MLTVWKFPIEANFNEIPMPRDAKVVSVALEPEPLDGSRGGIFLYALVDSNEPTEHRGFTLTGTGQPLDVPDGRELGPFIGTVGERFYFHIFEVM